MRGWTVLVVHAVWAEGTLVLWAEDSAGRAVTGSRAAVPAHPFSADADSLRAALVGAVGRAAAAVEPVSLVVSLPGSDRHPLPSPALVPPAGSPAVPSPVLRRWRVAGVAVRAGAAGLLAALRDCAADGLAVGPGLAHLCAVHAFAEHLVAAARVAPLVVGVPPCLRWRPLLAGADAAYFAELCAALPPSAHAHLDPGEPPSADVQVHAVLCALVDEVARERLGSAVPPGAAPWTAALTGPDARLRGAGARLAGELREAFDAAHRVGRPRLLLRLVEPEEEAGGDAWSLELWVQSAVDPSLRLPLRDLWRGEGGAWLGPEAEAAALRELDRAARVFSPLARAVEELAPDTVRLSLREAHAFVREAAPRLDAAGVTVLLPAWSGRSALALELTVHDRVPAGRGGLGVDDLVDFSLEAVLGGQRVDLEELAELARLKQPLVRLRGRWTMVDPGALQRTLELLRLRGRGRMRRSRAVALAVAPSAGLPVPVESVRADGALGALLGGDCEHRLTPLETPPGFEGELRPYQRRGAAWLRFLGDLGFGAILADDMGLGKTVQLLALLADERARGVSGPTLMVCPVSLTGNWLREAARFAPGLRVRLHHGPDRPHGNDLARLLGSTDLLVTTYGVVSRDVEELAAVPWRRVVCDEAQAIKNSTTRQARAVRALPADTRIALTGTPVENNLGELWSIMEFANPGLLGPAAQFERAFAAASAEGEDGARAAALLRRRVGPFLLRRLKTDRSIIADLPDKQEMRAWCTLTPEQASLYRAVVDEMAERLDGADRVRRRGVVLGALSKLKQICNHPAQFLGDGSALAGRSGKLERLEHLLGEAVAVGDKALCFTQYTAFGDRLAPYLAEVLGCEVLWLHGGTPRSRREEMTRRFQESAEPMVFLLSLKAAGTGLNLTAANHVVHVDRWWNPAVEDQATDRAFRIGQRRDVQVRKLVCVGTVEERVDELIERKKALAESVVGSGEEWLAELSVAELREVVRLSPEAVVG